jgi:predicted nucleic acid-binding protein
MPRVLKQKPDRRATINRCFVDSNIILHLLQTDPTRAEVAKSLLEKNPAISVQVLNEVTNVARRKAKVDWHVLDEFFATLRELCPTVPIMIDTHDRARALAERYQLAFYDALIVAAALLANAEVLYSEDMQHDMLFEGTLRVVNPFW